MSGLPSLPAINPALEPAAVRNGRPAAKQAYQQGVAFEQMLVDQLSKELQSTMGDDQSISPYASLMTQTLSSAVMAGGGTGIAMQLATALDPALNHSSSTADAGART